MWEMIGRIADVASLVTWDRIGKAADLVSLVSLAVSGYAAWQITAVKRKVSRRVAFDALADGYIGKISQVVARIRDGYLVFPDRREELILNISECVALLGLNREQLSKPGLAALRELERLQAECQSQWAGDRDGGEIGQQEDRILKIINRIYTCRETYQNLVELRRRGMIDDLG